MQIINTINRKLFFCGIAVLLTFLLNSCNVYQTCNANNEAENPFVFEKKQIILVHQNGDDCGTFLILLFFRYQGRQPRPCPPGSVVVYTWPILENEENIVWSTRNHMNLIFPTDFFYFFHGDSFAISFLLKDYRSKITDYHCEIVFFKEYMFNIKIKNEET